MNTTRECDACHGNGLTHGTYGIGRCDECDGSGEVEERRCDFCPRLAVSVDADDVATCCECLTVTIPAPPPTQRSLELPANDTGATEVVDDELELQLRAMQATACLIEDCRAVGLDPVKVCSVIRRAAERRTVGR